MCPKRPLVFPDLWMVVKKLKPIGIVDE